MRRAALIAAATLSSCATPQQPAGPYYNDEQYLVVGVRPDVEAAALIQQLGALGYNLLDRQNGHDFTALGFADEQGESSRVRVVTARGIALELDPVAADPVHEGVRYELLPQPIDETFDPDGDGFEEVFVHSVPASGEPPCILVYRVRDSGFVDFVPGKDFSLPQAADNPEGVWRDPEPAFCESGPGEESAGGEQPAEESAEQPAESPKPTPEPAKPTTDSPKAP